MKDTEKFKISKKLDLQENVEEIYVSRREIEDSHRVFVATDSSNISREINISSPKICLPQESSINHDKY